MKRRIRRTENSHWVKMSPWRSLVPYVQGPCTSPMPGSGPGLGQWGSRGDDGDAGLTGWRAPRWAACWLRTRGAEALGAWWTLGPAWGPAGVAAAVAAVAGEAEMEAALASLGGGPKRPGGRWHEGARLEGQ